MIPGKQFGFKTIYVTSGVESLLLDSVKLVISLLLSRKVRIIDVIEIHHYLNSICFTLFHFSALPNQNLSNTYHEVLLGQHIN